MFCSSQLLLTLKLYGYICDFLACYNKWMLSFQVEKDVFVKHHDPGGIIHINWVKVRMVSMQMLCETASAV